MKKKLYKKYYIFLKSINGKNYFIIFYINKYVDLNV